MSDENRNQDQETTEGVVHKYCLRYKQMTTNDPHSSIPGHMDCLKSHELSHLANRSKVDIQELNKRPESTVPQSPVDVFCWHFAVSQEIIPMTFKCINSFTKIVF